LPLGSSLGNSFIFSFYPFTPFIFSKRGKRVLIQEENKKTKKQEQEQEQKK
jgi:hypothetical protein